MNCVALRVEEGTAFPDLQSLENAANTVVIYNQT